MSIIVAILFVCFIMSILGLVVGFLIHMIWFGKDNLDKCLVKIENGDKYTTKKGNRLTINQKGMSYVYGKNDIVIIPTDFENYPIKFEKHRRLIYVNSTGNLIATPYTKQLTSERQYTSLIRDLTLSRIGSDMIKAMSGLKGNVIIIAIIALIIGLILGYLILTGINMAKPKITSPSQQTTLSTDNVTVLPPSGEIEITE